MILNRRYGPVGLVVLPDLVLFEFLSPVFSLLGLVVTTLAFALGFVSALYFVAFLLLSIGLSVALSATALTIEELNYRRYPSRRDALRLIGYALLEGLGYRQLNDVWRAIAYLDIARGKKTWGAQQRRGFTA
jgi:hypothetical protein